MNELLALKKHDYNELGLNISVLGSCDFESCGVSLAYIQGFKLSTLLQIILALHYA